MAKELLSPAATLTALQEQPLQIAAMTQGLNERQLNTAPEPGEWSCLEILAHLRACGDVWGGYIERMLNEENPTFRYLSPRTWIRSTDYAQQKFAPSLAAFSAQRRSLLAILAQLKPKDWQRGASVRTADRVHERDVHYYASNLATHENIHLSQFAKTIKAVHS